MKFYTDIFSQSWKVTRRNPVLWMLGVFILFWSGRSLDFEQVFNNAKLFSQAWSPFRPEFWDMDRWRSMMETFSSSPMFFIAFAIIIFAFSFFVFLLMNASHIGVVSAVAANATDFSFHDALKSTEKHMLRVLIVQVLNKVIMYGCVLLASAPFFFATFGTWKTVVATAVFLCTLPLTILVSIVAKYALVGVVVDSLTVKQAITTGWNMCMRNFGVSIEMALMMTLIFAGLNVAAIIAALLVLSPVFIGGSLIVIATQIVFPLFLHSILLSCVIAIFFLFSGSIFSAWHIGNWTLLYKRLSVESARSKTHRLLNNQKIG